MIGTLLILVLLVAAVWAIVAFNQLVKLRNRVRTAWADIDVQLKRRHDLIPQLVSAVKGYAGFERGVLTSVTELRSQAMAQKSPAQLGQTETELQRGVMQILALKEAYPALKANQNFLQLQRDLVDVEDNLQYARRFYNGAVRDYNTSIERFPRMLVAHAGGFTPDEFFSAEEDERSAVKVELDK
jgi:LemA protein